MLIFGECLYIMFAWKASRYLKLILRKWPYKAHSTSGLSRGFLSCCVQNGIQSPRFPYWSFKEMEEISWKAVEMTLQTFSSWSKDAAVFKEKSTTPSHTGIIIYKTHCTFLTSPHFITCFLFPYSKIPRKRLVVPYWLFLIELTACM